MKALSTPRYALLGLLLERPRHGYELYRNFTDPLGLGQVWHLGLSQMYVELKKLEAAGFVKSAVETQSSRPPKKIFTLTSAGRAAFHAWMETPARGVREMRLEFMARLFFARRIGRKALTRLIDQQRSALQHELDKLKVHKTDSIVLDEYGQLVRKFRASQLHAALDWLAACRNKSARPASVRLTIRQQTH